MFILTWNLAKFHRGSKGGREVAAAKAEKQKLKRLWRQQGEKSEGTFKESVFVSNVGRIIARKWKWRINSNIFLEDICSSNNLDKFLPNNNCTPKLAKNKNSECISSKFRTLGVPKRSAFVPWFRGLSVMPHCAGHSFFWNEDTPTCFYVHWDCFKVESNNKNAFWTLGWAV